MQFAMAPRRALAALQANCRRLLSSTPAQLVPPFSSAPTQYNSLAYCATMSSPFSTSMSAAQHMPNMQTSGPVDLAVSILKPQWDGPERSANGLAGSKDTSKVPILCLHGLFGSMSNFRTLGRNISERTGREVILADLRNHGRSPHADDMGYSAMASDIQHLLYRLQIPKVDIIGHSMGGKVAMMTALNFPSAVNRLMVVDVAPVAYSAKRETSRVAEVMAGLPLDADTIPDRKAAEKYLASFLPDVSMRRFILTNLVFDRDHHPSWRVNLPVIREQMQEISDFPAPSNASFKGPTEFLYGGNSDYVLPEYHGDIERHFPQHQLRCLPAGHWVHAEKPIEFVNAAVEFLSA